MNVHDSERMAGLLDRDGYDQTLSADEADLIIVNTCSVRERAEENLYHRLAEIRHLGGGGEGRHVVAVTG